MANELTTFTEVEEKKELIKSLYCKGLSENETNHFFAICHKRKLNPLTNQIYVWKFGTKMTIIVSIDGFRLIAERTKRYAPGRETVYAYKKDGSLLSATSYVKKQTNDGTWHEVSATSFFDEFNDAKKETWRKMPHVMLSKTAECQAIRKAFPEDLSGLYAPEEMDQAEEALAEAVLDDMTQDESSSMIAKHFELENDILLKAYLAYCLARTTMLVRDYTNKCLENQERFITHFDAWKTKQAIP
ncbi:MAG: phage recombination protein Bet [Bacteroidetes bacterium]|nr:phage recombination protein Bet [Bacteroidota bacterium]